MSVRNDIINIICQLHLLSVVFSLQMHYSGFYDGHKYKNDHIRSHGS